MTQPTNNSSGSGRLRANSVSLTYGDGDRIAHAVSDVSLEIPERGFYGIMGPSGSGKSSLLYLMSGLKRPSSGEIEYDGTRYRNLSERDITDLRRKRFGFVFQQPFLLNYLTSRENVLSAATQGDETAPERAETLFKALGVTTLVDKFPHHLSGGERQRVCVARAMISEPAIIFADEPTAALDHANGHVVIDLLASYKERGAVVIVTHDPEMVAGADHIYKMRDGRVED
jgi:putative ABC transport system ATP-binding protein